MKRQVFLLLVLAALVAGGVFAQKVGDTLNAFGKNYTVKDIRDGEVILMLTPTLDGTWKDEVGQVMTFNGNNAVYKQLNSVPVVQDAVKKGYVKVGDVVIRNLKKTGGLTWEAQRRLFTFNSNAPDVCTGVTWSSNFTITMSTDGKTISWNDGTAVFTRQ